jgi:hypothetical protein
MPKLFLVHCGFANNDLAGGIFEGHVDFFVAAEDFDEARAKAKELPEYKQRKMHVDGLIQVNHVDGFRVELRAAKRLGDEPGFLSQKGFSFRGRKKKAP